MPTFPATTTNPTMELRLGSDSNVLLDGGYSVKYDPSQLRDNQSPYMPNMAVINGELSKRPGQAYAYTASLGAGKINGIYERLFNGFKVFAWGTDIYKQSGSSPPVSIRSGLANSKGVFFTFGANLYYLNGTNYVVWDGVATSASNVAGYIPTLTISRPPAGGGTVNEPLNQLQPGFKDSFSGDGTSKVYQLSQTNLDATAVTAMVNGVAKAETTDFTVDRTTGKVTFTVAPPSGTPNNVVITAYKTISGYANRILNCTLAISYGGENDTRVFFSGNSSFPRRLFRTGVNDPTYWPDTGYQDVGSTESITALAKHFDKLIIFKPNSIYYSSFNNTAQQGLWGFAGMEVNFPTAPLNSAIGCDMPGSVQIIENNVVFGHSERGIFILVSTAVKDERVVRPISGNINGNSLRPDLLSISKSTLQDASSIDFDSKYILCVGNNAYVWDYRVSPFINTGDVAADEERLTWYYWTNINASCWMQDSQKVFYGYRTNGLLATFQDPFNDFGNSINGVWRSKVFDFNLSDWLKTVAEMWFTTRAGSYSSISIKYLDEQGSVLDAATLNTSSYSWARFAWNQFSFAVFQYAPTIRRKPKIKKVQYFQVEFSNSVLNQNLSILSLIIRYLTVRKVK